MLKVIIPIILLISIILIKKIPKIGGNINIGLIVAGLSALILGGIFNPIAWGMAWIDGIDRIAWVIALSFFGGIYAETQTEMGALETVLSSLRAKFGRSPRGLVVVIMISLGIAGSLLGDSIAASTVVGVLTIKSLADLGLKGEAISAIIVMGAALGAIMPPISQAVFLSASLMNIDPDPVTRIAYLTVGIGLVFSSIYAAYFFIKKDTRLPESLIPKETAGQILSKRWKTLIPLFVLTFIVVIRSVPGIKLDLIPMVLNKIIIGGEPLLKWLSKFVIIKGLSNVIVLAIIFATIVAYFYPGVRKNGKQVIVRGIKNVKVCNIIQLSTGLMLGGFYAGGQIEAVKVFAQGLNANMLKWGGGFSLTLLGMLTGTQSTPQTAVFSFLGPALEALGNNPVHLSIAGSHIAMAGQGLPPADLLTFVVAGLVGGVLGTKVDPLKSMFYSAPQCIYLFIVGMLFLYI